VELSGADLSDVFTLIGAVGGYDIVLSDDVKGKINYLRLNNKPWRSALSVIMQIKGLGMIDDDNGIIHIYPLEKILEKEKQKASIAKEKVKNESKITAYIPVSYTDLKNIIKPVEQELSTGDDDEKGSAFPDQRNKQLVIKDTPTVVEKIRALVSKLDTPERQVMIEARIVEARSNFSRNLGVSWGLENVENYTADELAQASDLGLDPGAVFNNWELPSSIGFGGSYIIPPALGNAGLGGAIQFTKFAADITTLDLRLSALEASGEGKIISRPRVTTLNGEKAKISQGTDIPYQTVSDGEIQTELVEAALSLEVTPVINPDNSIILEIKASNDSPGTTVATGAGEAPSIDKKSAETRVLVRDGETTVIGGIFVENEDSSESGVPLLRSIPFLGNLFKSSQKTKTRSELLVFVTPRIIR
jgi:type IV pilus assembly protein PilQ